MKRIILPGYIILSSIAHAQPYLDVLRTNYTYSPEGALNTKKNPLTSNFFNINLNVPIELKKGGDAFIINPFFEQNQGQVSGNDFHVLSKGLFVGFLKKDLFPNWNLLSAFIIRRNKEAGEDLPDDWQYGGAILTTYKRSEHLSLKFGIYYNKEFFGNYFMALAGIDWQIDKKNTLFGVLPGNLVFEHKVNQRLSYGSAFRALTNSYRLATTDSCINGNCGGKNYLRIDDNQLGIYGDVYLSKKIVLSGEMGYTILRRYRYGIKGENIHEKTDYRNDNFYFRASLAYRLSLR
ncbi:MAG: hypothetical protein C5B54_02520 [Acidobacteria bacterium]|nr:MAG: hypothetical protein C5B54_02520 [Acidobacteriota bacterium]